MDEAGAWNGKSSFVEANDTADNMTITVGHTDSNGKPVKHGTIAVFSKTAGSNTTTIDPSSDFTANQASVALDSVGDSVLYLYKGPSSSNDLGEWVVLSKFQVDTTNSLSGYATTADVNTAISNFAAANTTFSGNLTFSGLEVVTIPSVLASAGSSSSDAAQLTVSDRIHEVSGSDHVKLNAAAAGTVVTVINTDAQPITVHPDGASFTRIGANASFTLNALSAATFYFGSSTTIFEGS